MSPASTNHRIQHISAAAALTTTTASPQPIKSGNYQSLIAAFYLSMAQVPFLLVLLVLALGFLLVV
jgi:hypothetical protein